MAKMVKWVEHWFNNKYGWFLTNGNKGIAENNSRFVS